MAGPGFEADAAAMTKAISGFHQSATATKSTMSGLQSDLGWALSNSYQGNQAAAFQQLHTTLQEKMAKATGALDRMSSLMTDVSRNYNTGDSNATDDINKVAGAAANSAAGSVFNRLAGGA
ncbi:WXG100 family type VII secretion target [Crossiella sp. CA198]|uniref:WXG100 family type VII secretion target n=1 Tax=Crossiella sp. CA198 TaxID=3455607 RepID=UPI003F8D723B